MRVVLQVLRLKYTVINMRLEFDSQEEKDFILSKIVSNNILNRYIFDEICKSGPLGREIYSKLYGNRSDILRSGFVASEYSALRIDYDVVSKQSLIDLSRAIARAFAKVISDVIDSLDEYELVLHSNKKDRTLNNVEIIDKIALPENVIRELERREVDPTYECVVWMKADEDDGSIIVESDKIYSQDIAIASRDIDSDCNTGFNFYILRYTYSSPIAIIPPAPYSDYYGNCHDLHENSTNKDRINIHVPKGVNINEYISGIRNALLKDIQRIRDSNVLNLLVAAAYNDIYGKAYNNYYGDTLLYSDIISVPYGEVKVVVKRRWLLSPAVLELRLRLLNSNYVNAPNNSKEKSHVRFVFEYEGKDVRRVGMFSDADTIEKEYRTIDVFSPYHTLPLESGDIVYSRYKRILMSDFSVIDEVMETDRQLIRSIEQQIKNNPPYLIEESAYWHEYRTKWNSIPEVEAVASTDDFIDDFMTQEQKKKFVTYLVAQKLKKSAEAG